MNAVLRIGQLVILLYARSWIQFDQTMRITAIRQPHIAIVIEPHQTIVVEPGWQAALTAKNHLVLTRFRKLRRVAAIGTKADPVMLDQLFSPAPPPDPYRRAASHLDGAASLLMGFAANESIRTGQAVRTADLFRLPPSASSRSSEGRGSG